MLALNALDKVSIDALANLLSLGGLILGMQVFMVVLDIAAIFCTVKLWLLMAVMVVNVILGLLNMKYGGPLEQKTPVADWWEERGHPFVTNLEKPPSTRFSWFASPTSIKSADSKLIMIT